MLAKVAGFELRYQLRSPIFWITAIVFFGIAISLIVSDSLRIGWGGYVTRNSPFTIALLAMLMMLFGIFIPTTLAANTVLRDDETGFGPIVRTTRLSKFDYLFGRFTGGFLVCCLVYLSVPLGLAVGAYWPGTDPQTLGPFRLDTYLYAYLVMCVPTLFVLTASFFALATVTRSMLTTYLVALIVFMMYFLTAAYLQRAEFRDIMSLLDPFGLAPFRHATEHWSPNDRNTILPPFLGPMLKNRAIWMSVALVLLAWTWRSFRQDKPSDTKVQKPKAAEPVEARQAHTGFVAASLPRPATDSRSLGWGPLWTLARFDALSVLRSPAFFILVGIAFVFAIVGLWYAGDDSVTIARPVTRLMINVLNEQFFLLPLIIAAYYAGELVWRDRERRVHEFIDATPAADWSFVVPKIIAIAIVLITMDFISVAGALFVQVYRGYTNFEFGHYLWWYLTPWLLDMLLIAVLAVFIQMLVPNKYGGLLVTLLILAQRLAFPRFGWENHLYTYGMTSPIPLTDMNGQGEFAKFAAWYRLYWTAGATILAVLAYGLWRRGASAPLKSRMQRLPSRLKGTAGWIAGAAAVVMIAVGGYITYNTHYLNEWRTLVSSQRWQAEYERQLFPYRTLVQPHITDVKLDVDIHADEPSVVVNGEYMVENKTQGPLKEVHVTWPRQLESKSFLGTMILAELRLPVLEVQGAHLTREFPDLNYRIYTFDQPLQPGQRAKIVFQAVRQQHGFRNGGNEMRVVENGTFLDNFQLAPVLGPNHFLALDDRAVRRRYGLVDELRPPKLDDDSGRAYHYFRHDSDWVNAEITVTAAADQVLIAPGYKLDEKVENGRKTAHFKTEAPIHNFFSIQAARYAIGEDQWNDVKLDVYYHPAHAWNVERMLNSMKASLDYYSKNFSPYQFRQLRIVEFPSYMNFAQAFPGTIPYSEAAGFITDADDPNRVDFITYVTAHEIGHQWWAHQVIGADMQGQTVLSETLAQYSAIMVMEHMNPSQIRKFLKGSLDSYLRGRATDILGEVPLEEVEGQAHVRYSKGGLVMYLLKDQMGEDAVNRALKSMVDDYGFKGPPYPTSRDLIERLRAQAGPEQQDLITDLFQKITVYDLKVTGARKTRLADGKWSVAIDVDAHKRYADAKGVETEAPLDGSFDIGVFSAEPGKKDFTEDSVLSLQKQQVRTGKQTFSVVVEKEPTFVGFDPYNKYVDKDSEDNVLEVAEAEAAT